MSAILSVTELTFAIKRELESRFTLVSVKGEISNFKAQASGHLYFTLKDAQSQISCVLFKGNAQSLSRMPKEGDEVILKGELSVYAPRGNYQLIVRELQYAGVGELLMKLHLLKAKLEGQGWFAKERKKALPKLPKTIGVVTSPTGSVIQDILNILTRRFSGFHLILNPVKVQGEGAAEEIAAAIEQFNRFGLADVLIVGRGGGSLEDLWAFNEEIVASAIYQSRIPVISAVGHETDFSISDYVADVRAPTPSAAAEIVIAEKSQQLDFLDAAHKRLKHTLQLLIGQHKRQLEGFKRHPLLSSPYALLAQPYQRLDEIRAQMGILSRGVLQNKRVQLLGLRKQADALRPTTQISSLKQKLSQWDKALLVAAQTQISQKQERLKQLVSHLRAIDPRNLLTKGYCILFSEKKDSVILSTQELKQKQPLHILLHDGEVSASVEEITYATTQQPSPLI